jgi:transposase
MFYCGINLSARGSHLCVLDDNLSTLLQRKATNDLPLISSLLDPFKPSLKIVIESTFNWYWLVDGLHASGFDVCLAHSLGLSVISNEGGRCLCQEIYTVPPLAVCPQSL